jgi:phosphopantothenate-cysteine ligase
MSKIVLITSGATSEPLDPIRSITNNASGALGAITADAFCESQDTTKVFYLSGRTAHKPKPNAKLTQVTVTGTDSLESAIRSICADEHVDAIIHAMAVSDYKVRTLTTVETLAKQVIEHANTAQTTEKMSYVIKDAQGFDRTHKVSSHAGELVIITEPTQIVIALLRDLASDAKIIGFKLLSDVTHEQLIKAAREILVRNNCDFVLANDVTQIDATRHLGYLIDCAGNERRFDTKAEIAAGLVACVTQAWKGTN